MTTLGEHAMHVSKKTFPRTYCYKQALGGLLLIGVMGTVHADAAPQIVETEHLTLSIESVATGFQNPWAVAFLPDGRYLVSERRGTLNLVDPESGQSKALDGLPSVNHHGQGGLLDVVLHPSFGDGHNDWVYFTWSKPEGSNSRSALSRAKWHEDSLGEIEHLFEQDRASSPGRHYGSRLAWLADDTLLMSIGDRGVDPSRAQTTGDHAGSTLRLTATGGVPDDNPFVDDDNTLDEIYTLGNRNIQGMTVLNNGQAWASEHGPRTGDELNHLEPSKNYGWPEVSQGNDYATNQPIGVASLPGMADPVYLFEGRFAPSGLTEVTSDAFTGWHGNLLAGGLASETLLRVVLDNDQVVDEEIILKGQLGRIRDVRQGPDDAIYVLTDSAQGSLYRLKVAH